MANVAESNSEPALRAPWRSRALVAAAAVVTLGLGGFGFTPQFGGPGYEAALAAGVLLPVTTAIAVALETLGTGAAPLARVLRGIYAGLGLASLALVLTLLHGLRVGMCDPSEGLLLFLLGPSFGAALGGATGALVGLAVECLGWRRRWQRVAAVCLALGAPLTGILVSLVRFYTSPMVFAYDPYFGYFSGPLYDTVIGSLVPLATYRLGSLGSLMALVCGAALVERRGPGRLALYANFRPNVVMGGILALATSITVTAYGTDLGHFSTKASIEKALGREVHDGRCDVVHSSAIAPADALRLARDCDVHLRQIRRYFEADGPERLRVLLFANDVEKGRLMGASRTYIAKPWRNEVYLQGAPYPHPVLGHEIAHVVAGSFATGPFRVPGMLWGIVPDPGRIEGIAVAAALDENDELTSSEWAAAQAKIGLLPKLESLFQLGFFDQPASRAYTAAGAFLAFVRAEFGARVVREWYAGGSIERLTGASLAELDRRFRESLSRVPLPEAALNSARARFDRPSFFQRRCPRVIDRLSGEANARFGAGDFQGAREAYREILGLDARDASARLGLAACSTRTGDFDQAERVYSELAGDREAPIWAKLAALESRGDVLLRLGRYDAAERAYAELAQNLVDADRLRTLQVKRRASLGVSRDAISMLLIGDELGPSWDVAAPMLGEDTIREPASGLASYLVGRNLLTRGRYRHAAEHLDRALGRELLDGQVEDEALRLRLIAACALGDTGGASKARARLAPRLTRLARREGLERFAERCGLEPLARNN